MRRGINNGTKYLDAGIYTIAEAARLIPVPYARLWRWISGNPHTPDIPPLIQSDISLDDGQTIISFINLIEALFFSRFAKYGVDVRCIRAMAEEAKKLFDTQHPFATDIIFKSDGKRIFAEIAKKYKDRALYDLKKHNWAIEPLLGHGLKAAVAYGAKGFANRWYPRQDTDPHVILNPVASFGQPVLADSGIPTGTIHDAFEAEERDTAMVAKWFGIPEKRVTEAVRFEVALARAA